MNFKHLIYTLGVYSLIFSCSSGGDDPVSQPNPDPDPDPNPTTKVTYNADVKIIIDGNCISCHGSPTSNGAPMSLITYTQVKNNVNSIISRINSTTNPMPQSGLLPQADRTLIQQWKDGGLLEN